MFEYEPFEAFRSKVLNLCTDQWPHLTPSAFTVTHMDGGSYNRVIGIQVDQSQKQMSWLSRTAQAVLRTICSVSIRKASVKDYVLRIPHYEHALVDREVALLQYLSQTTIPVPQIKTVRLSNNNALGSRFTIQPRLRGKPDDEIWIDLNNQQRLCFARDLSAALRQITQIHSSSPGTLDPDAILAGAQSALLLRLQCPPRNAHRPGSSEPFTTSSPQPAYDLLLEQFERQGAYDLTLNRKYTDPWRPFTAITQHLHNLGFLDEVIYTLTQMDMAPRNMLLDTPSPNTASLTGILDWDEAVFAPVFTACQPPSWLWDFEGGDHEELNEAAAHVMRSDPELAAIKRAFEDAVGEEFYRFAYTPEYRIARGIARLSIMGFHSNADYGLAEGVVR